MSTSENIAQWSVTAASNATADTGLNWAEGQAPGTVNNSARGMMAALAKWRLDVGGALVAGGSANALTVTTNSLLEAAQLADGLMLVVRATADNSSATVTLNPDSRGALNIKRADGSALAVGSIKSGAILLLFYVAGSSEWRAANIGPDLSAISGSLTVGGAVTMSSTLAVTGASTFTGAAAMNGGGVLGDAAGDAVTIKGTVVSAYMAGLLATADVTALRTALGLGTMATLNSPLPVANGGTGQTTAAAGARALLDGLGTTKGHTLWYNTSWVALTPP